MAVERYLVNGRTGGEQSHGVLIPNSRLAEVFLSYNSASIVTFLFLFLIFFGCHWIGARYWFLTLGSGIVLNKSLAIGERNALLLEYGLLWVTSLNVYQVRRCPCTKIITQYYP